VIEQDAGLALRTPEDWLRQIKVRRSLRKIRTSGDLTPVKDLSSVVAKANYRVKERRLDQRVTLNQWELILEMCDWKCLRCGDDSWLEMDHVVPLALGGAHLASNVQPLCKECSHYKGANQVEDLRPAWLRAWVWEIEA
jgi:5-methylcytosine-specific restriction endonuclease McrA